MKKIRVSAVSYLNSAPFIYGIENSPKLLSQIEFSKDIPSECARKLLENEVDIGLIPASSIPDIRSPHIITDFCIGTNGKVDSVMLHCDEPLEKIETILFDNQSLISTRLCQLLCERFWNISPQFKASDVGLASKIKGSTAGLVIGDPNFQMPQKNTYKYDLAEQWKKWTNSPFVFKTWVSNKALPIDFLVEFGRALEKGAVNLELAIKEDKTSTLASEAKLKYLKNNISYTLDDSKKKGLNIFLQHIRNEVDRYNS